MIRFKENLQVYEHYSKVRLGKRLATAKWNVIKEFKDIGKSSAADVIITRDKERY